MQRWLSSRSSADPAENLPLSAWISVDEQRQPCFVVDLTADGARIHCAKPAQTGAKVELCLPDHYRLRAEVVWQSGNRMGLKFAEVKTKVLV